MTAFPQDQKRRCDGLYKRVLIADITPDVSGAISLGPFGSNLNTQHYTEDGLPVIRGVNLAGDRFSEESFAFTSPSLAEKFPRSVVYPGDIVFSYKGTIGQVGIIPKNGHFDRYIISPSHLKLTVDRTKVDPEFVFYFFKSPLGQQALLANVSSTGTPGIIQPTKTLARIELPLPELSKQRAIAHILDTLDDKIELNRRMNETLECIARALFKSWFIDFDPVRAKAEGRQPFGMDEETAAMFPDQFEDSERGEIPKGWTIGKIDDVLSIKKETVSPLQYPGDSFLYYSIPAYDGGKEPIIEYGINIKSNKFLLTTDCVLLSKLNPRIIRVWNVSIENYDSVRLICSTEFIVSQPKDGWSLEYLTCLFSTNKFNEEYSCMVTGTSGSHQRVQPDSFKEIKNVIPPESLVQLFTRLTRPLIKQIDVNSNQNKTLRTIRSVLLPVLTSGDIRIDPSKFGFSPEGDKVGEV